MQLRLANWGKLKAIFEPAKSTESPVKRPLIGFLENTLELVQPMIHLEGFDDTSWRIELTSLQPCCVVCGDWEFGQAIPAVLILKGKRGQICATYW